MKKHVQLLLVLRNLLTHKNVWKDILKRYADYTLL
jgi:hypothetical protein